MSEHKYRCPICYSELSVHKNTRLNREWMVCSKCCLWSNIMVGRGYQARMVTRWGFVKIKNGIKDYENHVLSSITETLAIVNETRALWEHNEYRDNYIKIWYATEGETLTEDMKPIPHFAMYDLLGDWGLTRQQQAFGELIPKMEPNNYHWRSYSCSIEYNEV